MKIQGSLVWAKPPVLSVIRHCSTLLLCSRVAVVPVGRNAFNCSFLVLFFLCWQEFITGCYKSEHLSCAYLCFLFAAHVFFLKHTLQFLFLEAKPLVEIRIQLRSVSARCNSCDFEMLLKVIVYSARDTFIYTAPVNEKRK